MVQLQHCQIARGLANNDKAERSYTQLESRKQVISFWDKVTIRLKGGSTPTKRSKTLRHSENKNVR